jgi:predicted enzyme related to lactoylglutathione lyase
MKTEKMCIKVTNKNKSFLYPCSAVGTTIFLNITEAEETLNKLKNRSGCIVYPQDHTFEIVKKADVIDLFSCINYKVNI